MFLLVNTSKTYPDGRKEQRSEVKLGAVLTRSLYVPIAIGIMLLGGMFGCLGVLLVYLGAKGNTNIMLFGQKMETADVGVASIFIGAVTVILVIRRLLKSAEKLTNQEINQ